MTNLGHYTLQDELGRGGLAIVYLATHGALGNQVAIKVLSPFLADEENARKRFAEEAQAASALEHPSIVRILDLDEEAGQVFIAMDYISGGSLQKRLTTSIPFLQNEIINILGQVANALDYAHGQSILHRDVKPSNILLGPDGKAYLTDFGLAGVVEALPISKASSVAGNSAYLSPEKAEGKALDGKADQYSLAVIAYEILVGELPFKGESSTAVALLHVTRQPPDPCVLNSQLPVEAGEILLRGLSKDPSQRFGSCAEFIKSLGSAMASSQLRQFHQLLDESRRYLETGQVVDARSRLESARRILVDRPELQVAFAELDAISQTAESYEQMIIEWQTANQKAQEVLEAFPNYPDPQKVFISLGLRKPVWSRPAPRELAAQVALGLILGLPFMGLMLFLAFRWIIR